MYSSWTYSLALVFLHYVLVMGSGTLDYVQLTISMILWSIAFNHFGEGLIQRMPRCRHGYFHVVNNDYTHWEMYAIGGSAAPTINSQGNRFLAPNLRSNKEVIAEMLGTYFVIFAGEAAVIVNLAESNVVTLPGISLVWGLAVMVYSVGHISGAHFNPDVTISFATCKRFPWKQVPPYIIAQVGGSTLASGTFRLIFNGKQDVFSGTLPSESDLQSFVLEFVITFYLMFVISGVATDNHVIGELGGLAVGATIVVNVMLAGPILGASMNPARSLGPAIVASEEYGFGIRIDLLVNLFVLKLVWFPVKYFV